MHRNLRTRGAGLLLASGLALAGCDQPGPLSAAARGTAPRPAPPAWAPPLLETDLATAFPGTTTCEGAIGGLGQRYAEARAVTGWARDPATGAPVRRVAAVNRKGRFVGFGDGGQPVEGGRGDVGWSLVTGAPAKNGVRVYGLDAERRAACLLGEIVIPG